jgi:hypothetical protein
MFNFFGIETFFSFHTIVKHNNQTISHLSADIFFILNQNIVSKFSKLHKVPFRHYKTGKHSVLLSRFSDFDSKNQMSFWFWLFFKLVDLLWCYNFFPPKQIFCYQNFFKITLFRFISLLTLFGRTPNILF